jgi:hypothetical protein
MTGSTSAHRHLSSNTVAVLQRGVAGLALAAASLLACAQTPPARAAAPAATPATSATSIPAKARFGVVLHVSGDVSIGRVGEEKARPLNAGDVVYVGERIRTGQTGEALVKTDDAGMVGARPNTDFYAEHFTATGLDSDNMALRLARGSLRIITGWIGRLTPNNYKVTTPTATIGVRGTDHEPYVLSDQAAAGTPYKPGSYDKVNQGRTFISAGGRELDVDVGQVGVAPATPGIKTRGLMTLALPYLLDHVPEFYQGGKFEDEMDAYSKDAQTSSLERHKQVADSLPAQARCAPLEIARSWIGRFDDALVRRDVDGIMAQFAADASVQLTVRDGAGNPITNTLTRDELAKSSAAATAGLTDYSQKRETLDAEQLPGQAPGDCQRIYVESLVTEQGRMSGKPYRIESREEYVLEHRDDRWLAVHATSTQR